MENNQIANGHITASDQISGWSAQGARLNNDKAWATQLQDGNQWIEITFYPKQYVTGVITQGQNNAWVKTYKVEFKEDGNGWKFVSDTVGGPAKVGLFTATDNVLKIYLIKTPIKS